MLLNLTIRNYALIRELEIAPSRQLNVVTGETGAGKSIMLGAIGLLLGNRADAKALWDENEKCSVEGVFDVSEYRMKSLFEKLDLDYEDQTVIRREISPSGKSRAFINDTPVTLDVMRTIGDRLLHIHSQHETLDLANKGFQLSLIDSFAGNEKLLDAYTEVWRDYLAAKTSLEALTSEAEALRQEHDFIKFQWEELSKAELREGELQALEAEQQVQDHAEEIKLNLANAYAILENAEVSVRSALGSVRAQLNAIATFSPVYEKLLERFETTRIELEDIANEIQNEEERIEFDPERAQETRDRLSTIYQLLKKHRVATVAQLLELQQQLEQRYRKSSNLEGELAQSQAAVTKLKKQVDECGTKLSAARQKTFTPLSKQMAGLLKELGMPDATVKIDHHLMEATSTGVDSIELLFSANKGIGPKPLAQVASGGEFSRFMFAIQYILADKTSLPTLILDEIDTGVSGEIALQLGRMMNQMAEKHQLIAITHLPQIAAKGEAHFFVYKDNSSAKTISHIKQLTQKERIEEIAKMISGAKPSAKAVENAKELMQL